MSIWNRTACVVVLLVAAIFLADARARATRTSDAVAAQEGTPARQADLVLRGGKIVTVDDAPPGVEALAVIGDTIAAVGSNREIQAYIGTRTRVIDLTGALAVPGFIDAHAHFTGVGEAARNLKLATAND